MNSYKEVVQAYAHLLEAGKKIPLGNVRPLGRPPLPADAPKALFFAPHPDDECISGGLGLRLMREAGMQLINVAVTQGSKRERQAERWRELQNACDYLGFGLVGTGPNGLERITPKTREDDPQYWAGCVGIIIEILRTHQPRVIFFPHRHDWNGTHIGTHFLVMDALGQLPASF